MARSYACDLIIIHKISLAVNFWCNSTLGSGDPKMCKFLNSDILYSSSDIVSHFEFPGLLTPYSRSSVSIMIVVD